MPKKDGKKTGKPKKPDAPPGFPFELPEGWTAVEITPNVETMSTMLRELLPTAVYTLLTDLLSTAQGCGAISRFVERDETEGYNAAHIRRAGIRIVSAIESVVKGVELSDEGREDLLQRIDAYRNDFVRVPE